MATTDEMINKFQSITECPVCLEQLKEPRTLPCQHSFCTECLERISRTRRKIKCPCCNKETQVPYGVRELPVDFRANSWLEILSEYERGKVSREAEAEEAAQETVHGAEAALPEDSFAFMSIDEHCPVCKEIPVVSENLRCGHSLCRKCVQFLIPVGGDTVHCPTCSFQTTIVTSTTGSHTPSGQSQEETAPAESQLTFHPICGRNVTIQNNQMTACRTFPLESGLVLTSRHLKPNELFEVKLEKNVDKWEAKICIGVTTKSPTEALGAAWMGKLGSGTYCCSTTFSLEKGGKSYNQSQFGLKVGETVGVMRKENGYLHFYRNGAHLGAAANNVPADVYGVVDIPRNAVQVTIIQPSDRHTGPEKSSSGSNKCTVS